MRRIWAAAFLLLALPACVAAQAAPAADPTVIEVLTRVRQNYVDYLQTVPNLLADEHLATDVHGSPVDLRTSAGNRATVADSVFTLRRSSGGKSKLPTLTESREIKVMDHRPAEPGATLDSPVMFSGAFSYASGFLLPELTECYDYKLKPNQKLKNRPVLVLDYASRSKGLIPGACVVREPLSGRAFFDPQTMHIVRIEQKRPKHILENLGLVSRSETSAEVTWEWTIDYVPVELDGRTFWLATTVNSTMQANSIVPGSPHLNWTFLASYRNYHLLTVHSKILPGVNSGSTP